MCRQLLNTYEHEEASRMSAVFGSPRVREPERGDLVSELEWCPQALL